MNISREEREKEHFHVAKLSVLNEKYKLSPCQLIQLKRILNTEYISIILLVIILIRDIFTQNSFKVNRLTTLFLLQTILEKRII